MTKKELRKKYLHLRATLTEGEVAHLSRKLCDNFFLSIDLSFIRALHTYLPIQSKNEPDTWLILDRIRREFPQIQISLPKVVNDQLENYRFEGMHQLKQNAWGIWEPQQGVLTDSSKIDLVIVPLLTFDHAGNRVGYGKGYYDRFLKNCRPDCKKIGLSFFEAEERIEDADSLDVTLSAVITPIKLSTF